MQVRAGCEDGNKIHAVLLFTIIIRMYGTEKEKKEKVKVLYITIRWFVEVIAFVRENMQAGGRRPDFASAKYEVDLRLPEENLFSLLCVCHLARRCLLSRGKKWTSS